MQEKYCNDEAYNEFYQEFIGKLPWIPWVDVGPGWLGVGLREEVKSNV